MMEEGDAFVFGYTGNEAMDSFSAGLFPHCGTEG